MYSIESDCQQFIRSIYCELGEKNCTVEKNGKKIIVRGKKVETLDIFLKGCQNKCGNPVLSYHDCLKMLRDLEKQNRELFSESLCIFCIRVEDILVVDGEKFIFVNDDYVKKVDLGGKISFFSPFRRVGFFSPELDAIDVLPSSVDWKTFYYSLGLLIVFCISDKRIEDKSLLIDSLKHVEKTKLYWTILRMVKVEPDKRCFLYI
jgi:hypothetical protein